MHLFFYARGIYNQVEFFKTLAQSQYWKWFRINLKTKKEEMILVQGALRPTILGAYEYIFPEECLSEVLSVFGIPDASTTSRLQGYGLRKLFKCEKIPKENLEEAKKIETTLSITGHMRGLTKVQVEGVGIIPIGIKRDKREKWEDIGYEQEML